MMVALPNSPVGHYGLPLPLWASVTGSTQPLLLCLLPLLCPFLIVLVLFCSVFNLCFYRPCSNLNPMRWLILISQLVGLSNIQGTSDGDSRYRSRGLYLWIDPEMDAKDYSIIKWCWKLGGEALLEEASHWVECPWKYISMISVLWDLVRLSSPPCIMLSLLPVLNDSPFIPISRHAQPPPSTETSHVSFLLFRSQLKWPP